MKPIKSMKPMNADRPVAAAAAALFGLVLSGTTVTTLAQSLTESLDRPVPITSDTRIREVVTRGDVALRLEVGPYPTLIELDASETIVDLAVASEARPAKSWDVVWRTGQSYVFVAARAHSKATALAIKTTSHSYFFDLVPVGAMSLFDPTRIAKLIVKYPQSTEDADACALPAKHAEVAELLRRNDLYTLSVVAEREDIRPRDVFDDGRFTYLRFPNNLEIPAIYRSIPGSGEEQLVNSHLDGDTVVVHGTAPLWNLRLGGSVLGIFNEAYDPDGVPPTNGRTVSGSVRTLAREPR